MDNIFGNPIGPSVLARAVGVLNLDQPGEQNMRNIHHALITAAAIALAALTVSAADAQYAPSPYGAYDYYGGPSEGTYYGYGANQAYDFQLQGDR